MEDPQEEIKELRSKDICEQQLAVELAIGAVDSIDSLIEQGHEIACEYACQLLFDNLREKVASQKNLPVRIVQHLLKDRCEHIRLEVSKWNWSILTKDQQEEFICEAERHFSTEKKKGRNSYEFRHNHKTRQIRYVVADLLKNALCERDEPAVLRYIEILGMSNIQYVLGSVESLPALKDMPKVFKLCWENNGNNKKDLILIHPDESVRMKEIQKILDKETRVYHLSAWRGIVPIDGVDEFKTKILILWVADPSEAIRKFIATTTTSADVLEMLSTDSSNIVSQIAYPRYKKFQKRTNYSKAYNQHKKEKLQQDKESR